MYKTTIFKHHIVNKRIVVVYSIQYSMWCLWVRDKGGGGGGSCMPFFSSNDNSLSRMSHDMYIFEFSICKGMIDACICIGRNVKFEMQPHRTKVVFYLVKFSNIRSLQLSKHLLNCRCVASSP